MQAHENRVVYGKSILMLFVVEIFFVWRYAGFREVDNFADWLSIVAAFFADHLVLSVAVGWATGISDQPLWLSSSHGQTI